MKKIGVKKEKKQVASEEATLPEAANGEAANGEAAVVPVEGSLPVGPAAEPPKEGEPRFLWE